MGLYRHFSGGLTGIAAASFQLKQGPHHYDPELWKRGEHIVDPVAPFEELITAYPKIWSDPGSNIKLGARF